MEKLLEQLLEANPATATAVVALKKRDENDFCDRVQRMLYTNFIGLAQSLNE